MPINHSLKIIFVHVPKAAGTTVERFFHEATGEKWDLWGKIHSDQAVKEKFPSSENISRFNPDRINNNPRHSLYHHLTLSDIRKLVGVDIYSKYTKLCVVRNPWDRLVSFYEYGRQTGGRLLTEGKTFRNWFWDRPVTPQILPYVEVDNQIPGGLKVIRFDAFNEDMEQFVSEMGLEWPGDIHEKKTVRRPYRDYYDEEMRLHLIKECERDVKCFNLGF